MDLAPSGFAIEILAGIPSVVIGLWGLLTFGPWLAKNIYPTLATIAQHLPNVGRSATGAIRWAPGRVC